MLRLRKVNIKIVGMAIWTFPLTELLREALVVECTMTAVRYYLFLPERFH
jgi:hypothetical protein